jgi:hypothetical protein
MVAENNALDNFFCQRYIHRVIFMRQLYAAHGDPISGKPSDPGQRWPGDDFLGANQFYKLFSNSYLPFSIQYSNKARKPPRIQSLRLTQNHPTSHAAQMYFRKICSNFFARRQRQRQKRIPTKFFKHQNRPTKIFALAKQLVNAVKFLHKKIRAAECIP